MNRLSTLILTLIASTGLMAQPGSSYMEKLDRGVVVVPATSGGQFVSWRLLGTDDADNVVFDVLRDGTAIKTNLADVTNYTDAEGSTASEYQIVAKRSYGGEAYDTSKKVKSWGDIYKSLPLDKPADYTNSKGFTCTYTPNDCSAADMDGDGEYEIILKWDPSNSQDNSKTGSGGEFTTGPVYIDCYKLDGTKLWRIDLGQNIRAGAHYTQFLAYDFDGDGRGELICKTAPGTKDGQGNYANQASDIATIKGHDNSLSFVSSAGTITSGPEYLTVFEGTTGRAIHTTWYNPNRAGTYNKVGAQPSDKSFWGDNYGNRCERYLATVAFLGGKDENPSAVMVRGYYTRSYLWAVDFDGSKLTTRWLHASTSASSATRFGSTLSGGTTKTYSKSTAGVGSHTMYGNGNHNLSTADVDGDGFDEIIFGSAALDHDGYLLYATGYGHGDAIHLSDLIPSRPGLEVFEVHEEKTGGYGWDVHDAATGEIIHSATGDADNGRGISGDFDANNAGFEFSSSNDRAMRSATTGDVVSSKSTSLNFRAYWDGDLQDELLDGNTMDKWNGNGTSRIYPKSGKNFYDIASSSTCNSTKKTPNLLADILGDWREELLLWDSSDAAHLNIFTTNVKTDYMVPTLMHDHVYRMGITWQNTAYNQPPHLGYYLPDLLLTRCIVEGPGAMEQTIALGDSIKPVNLRYRNVSTAAALAATVSPDGTTTTGATGYPAGFNYSRNILRRTVHLDGKPEQMGDYRFIFDSGRNIVDKAIAHDTVTIHVADPTGIDRIIARENGQWAKLLTPHITDRLTFRLDLPTTQTADITLYSTSGARVYHLRQQIGHNAPITILGLGHLATGIYVLDIRTAEGHWQKKIGKK